MSENETSDMPPQFAEIAEPAGVDTETETKRRVTRGTVILGVLIVAAVGGLALMHFRAGPSTAQASSDAANTINSFLGDGKKNLATMQQALHDTDKLVNDFQNFPAAAQVPLEDLQRNPFSDGKSVATPGEQVVESDRQIKLEQALKRVSTLKVQSIMFGEVTRSCMVDGRFRAEGDSFDDYTVERINPASVIVRTNGFRFEIKVKN